MSKINSKEELKKILNIEKIEDLKDPKNQKTLIKKLKTNTLSPELLKDVLSTVPELAKAFTEVIKAMKDIGISLEESVRFRWQVLQEIASKGILTGDQVLEAMRIIKEIEDRVGIDWESVFKTALKVLGFIASVVIFVLSRGKAKTSV